ncbi:MAG TPA: glycoside hydrolase family 5 protein, partial [Rhodothermales bacterium]|nr:glycoside hydrolase family 5 protein [Rhodothermales bacterium]
EAAEPPPGFVGVDGKEIVSPAGEPLMLRGINLGNWMVPEGYMFKFDTAVAPWQIQQIVKELVGPEQARVFWQQWQDTFITRDDIHYVKQMGMNVIRLPFDYRWFTPEDRPGVWLDRGFELMDRVVQWSAGDSIYVLLDMHAAPCGQTGENIDNSYGYPFLYDDPACRARTAEVWRHIAEHYAQNPTVIGYDLLNEPIPHYPEYQRFNPELEPVYKQIAAAVRAVDPNHLLFLGGAQWDSNFEVFTDPHFDDKLVFTFHKYWTAPTPEVIQPYVAFRDTNDVPIFMGESGENTDEWVASFRKTLEDERIGWTFWPYKKMDDASSPRTYDHPLYWDEIVAYQKLFGASFEEKRKVRPSPEHVKAALDGLLQNIRFENNRVNPGYIRALGMTP